MMKSKKFSPTPSKRVVAIDPGFDRMGVAVISEDGGRNSLLFSTCINTNSKDSRGERLLYIGKKLEEIINAWRPESMAIETLFFNTNTTSAIGVAEARGVSIYQGAKAGLKIFEYSPQSIKLAVTGYGKADKVQIETMVKKLVKLPEQVSKRLDDELDAIALGITHLATKKSI